MMSHRRSSSLKAYSPLLLPETRSARPQWHPFGKSDPPTSEPWITAKQHKLTARIKLAKLRSLHMAAIQFP